MRRVLLGILVFSLLISGCAVSSYTPYEITTMTPQQRDYAYQECLRQCSVTAGAAGVASLGAFIGGAVTGNTPAMAGGALGGAGSLVGVNLCYKRCYDRFYGSVR